MTYLCIKEEFVFPMILNKISIINFKNIGEATLLMSPKINCFIGNNGVGKTNILDSIYYLSFCRSYFNSVDSQNIRHGEEFFVLDGSYSDDNGNAMNVYCGMKRGAKKHFKRDKKEYKKLSQHIGLIPLIFITPNDVSLIDGGSEERRRFMDVVISQYDHSYIEALSAYNTALVQRNSLLKVERPDETLLDIWEGEMARYGEIIYNKRDNFIKEFIPVFQSVYDRISGNKERVSLHYVSHAQRGALLDVIRNSRSKDCILGYSLHGVHRDDLNMMLGDYQMKREGSQGQNKTFVLALKLSQFDFLRRTVSNTTPLLLLDDIFDKLDADRVERIIGLVSGENYGQIFITDTNREHLDRILEKGSFNYKLFIVENGDVKENKDV